MRHRNGHSVSRNASRWSELGGTALHRCPRQPPVLRALADRDLSTNEAERPQRPVRETTQPDAASWGTCVGPPARLTGRARAECERGWPLVLDRYRDHAGQPGDHENGGTWVALLHRPGPSRRKPGP